MSMLEIVGTAIKYLLILLVLAYWVLVIIRFVKNIHSPVRTVRAIVVDKYKTQTVSRIQGTFKRKRYIIVFAVGDKKLVFAVSEFSYTGYKLNDEGTLKYKGDRIIDFI